MAGLALKRAELGLLQGSNTCRDRIGEGRGGTIRSGLCISIEEGQGHEEEGFKQFIIKAFYFGQYFCGNSRSDESVGFLKFNLSG